jgi:hypothetical protein
MVRRRTANVAVGNVAVGNVAVGTGAPCRGHDGGADSFMTPT